MARKYWVSGNYGDVRREQRVIRICRRATEIDPNYARAWALMAISQANLYFTHGNKDESALPAAERALEIEPAIAEAHCVKARYLLESGDTDEANEEVELALRLGPESWEVNREAARLYYWQRRIPEATRCFEKAVRILESDFHAWGMLASCYEALGDRQGVMRAAHNMVFQSQRVLTEDPSNAAALGIGAGGLAIQGELERTREWIERALLIDPDNLLMRYNFACVTTLYLNDPEGALDLLEFIFQRMSATFFRSASKDPDLDSLRNHPRFRKIAAEARERLGLTA
jgi:adenylate cyclase